MSPQNPHASALRWRLRRRRARWRRRHGLGGAALLELSQPLARPTNRVALRLDFYLELLAPALELRDLALTSTGELALEPPDAPLARHDLGAQPALLSRQLSDSRSEHDTARDVAHVARVSDGDVQLHVVVDVEALCLAVSSAGFELGPIDSDRDPAPVGHEARVPVPPVILGQQRNSTVCRRVHNETPGQEQPTRDGPAVVVLIAEPTVVTEQAVAISDAERHRRSTPVGIRREREFFRRDGVQRGRRVELLVALDDDGVVHARAVEHDVVANEK